MERLLLQKTIDYDNWLFTLINGVIHTDMGIRTSRTTSWVAICEGGGFTGEVIHAIPQTIKRKVNRWAKGYNSETFKVV